MAHYTLITGTKNWSSWSMRPWVLMKTKGLAFDEVQIALRQGEATRAAIALHSPSGFVPLLKTGDGFKVWDSLAICEFLAERHGELALWPQDLRARATARAVVSEMHAGFAALRRELPMDCLARVSNHPVSAEAARDIARICAIWQGLRAAHEREGPYLFGTFTIADAFYAPVVSRFVTYDVALGSVERAYVETMLALPAMAAWMAACAAPAPAPPRAPA